MSVITTWGPFVITILYTVVACILGYNAKGKLDMDKVENWSSSGNTLGIIVMIFLTGAGNVSSYTSSELRAGDTAEAWHAFTLSFTWHSSFIHAT